MLKLTFLVVLMVIIGTPILASKFLPWWGTLVVLGAEVVLLMAFGPRLIGWGVKRFLLNLFTIKSRVLRNAKVTLHSVAWTVKPELIEPEAGELAKGEADEEEAAEDQDDEDDSDEDEDTRFLLVDFTLTPPAPSGPMQYYDIFEVLLVPFDAKVSMSEDPSSDDLSAGVHEARMVDEEGNETAEFDKVTGEHRFRIIFACPDELAGRVKLRYYFEQFGDFTLPSAVS